MLTYKININTILYTYPSSNCDKGIDPDWNGSKAIGMTRLMALANMYNTPPTPHVVPNIAAAPVAGHSVVLPPVSIGLCVSHFLLDEDDDAPPRETNFDAAVVAVAVALFWNVVVPPNAPLPGDDLVPVRKNVPPASLEKPQAKLARTAIKVKEREGLIMLR